MRRRTVAAATALTTALMAGGCSASTDSSDSAKETSRTPVASTTPSSEAPESRESSLGLPEGAKVLVPEVSGNSDQELRKFTLSGDVYTVYARCSGKGTVQLVDRVNGSEPHSISCDGVRTVGHVFTDTKRQALKVRVTDGNPSWTIAVVSGEHAA